MHSLKISFLCIIFSLKLSAQSSEENNFYKKYLIYKNRFYSNFIRIDWGGDGIGTFAESDKKNQAWFGHYVKAGYSLPASSHHPTKNRYWWPFNVNDSPQQSLCNLNPDLSDENGVLVWNEDTGLYLGMYLSVLATEYELLRREGQKKQLKQKLEEIFLALQAFRRLNLTANHWVKRYIEVSDYKCNSKWIADFSGFSGLCIRNDVPYNFWEKFHMKSLKHNDYGHLNPTATDEFGSKPFNKPGYNCADEPNGVPDIRNIYAASQLCCQAHPLCGYKDKDCSFAYLSPTDSKKLAHEIFAEKYFSQDQVIGLLSGLSLIKKYIPDDAVHIGPEGENNIIEMTKKITLSLVSSLTGPGKSFFSPPCIGKPNNYAGTNSCGYDWRLTKYGICEAVSFICDSSICRGNYSNFASLLVQGFILGKKPILIDKSGKNEKRRMNFSFYHTLLAITDSDRISLKNSLKDAKNYAPWIEPYYPLLRMLLHDYSDRAMSKAGKKYNFAFEQYLFKMQDILNSYAMYGNCIPAQQKTDCFTEGYPLSNIQCDGSYIHHPGEMTGNRIGEWYPYGDNFYGNGLDYMLLYNFYRLAFPYEKRPAYNLN